jgi:hypothetical protein
MLPPGELPAGGHAATMPPDCFSIPAQERFGVLALQVGLVGERVCAR